MSKNLALCLIALNFTLTSHARAEEKVTQPMANSYCAHFVEKPDDFKPIKNTDVCIANERQANEKVPCFETKVFGAHEPRKFAVLPMGGTCPGATILELDNFVQPPNVFQTVKGSWEHAAGSQYVDQAYIAVQYDGQLFFTNSKKSLLQLATDRGNVVLCQIKNELKKWHSPDVCQEFADNKFTSLENRLEKRKRAKDYVVDALPSMDIPYETDVDINNDGRPYKVYSVVYDSSAGCGGRSEFLSIGGNIPEKKYGLNVELRKLTKIDLGQEGHWSFIKIQGKNYLAKNAEFPSQASASEPLRQEEDFGDRVLYAAAGWHFEEICRLKPLTKKVFDTTESFK